MNRKPILILVLALLFSTLFYEQLFGLNLFLFGVALSFSAVYDNRDLLRNKGWVMSNMATLIASMGLIYYGNALSIIAVMVGILVTSGLSKSHYSTVFTAYLRGFSSLFAAPFKKYNALKAWVVSQEIKPTKWRKVLLSAVIGVVVLVFLLLYRSANPIFEAWTNQINFGFIEFPWLIFTVFGAWLAFALLYPISLSLLGEFDEKSRLIISETSVTEVNFMGYNVRMSDELFLAKWTLLTLNLLLFVVNLGDLNFIFNGHQLPDNVNFASYLHRGVGTLIFSIILSIAIVLVFFRGNLNFCQHSKTLKTLALIWIVQNLILLVAVVVKNHLYIGYYGLTYKRIGVYTYTFLTCLGLISTIIKLIRNRNNGYLFFFNGWSFFFTLSFATLINWDAVIIQNNKNFKAEIDIYYLLSLSDNSIPELQKLTSFIKNEDDKMTFEHRLNQKTIDFLEYEERRTWQSWCYKRIQTRKILEE
jgi:hypothetical protein